ncbi:hypothetical protein EQG49_06780 [Periweissella cryptocerci]|uniref:DUF5626 domain-containing protein n=1 Tax=Periweissella cryptocerci TaxID=2506420 RepID=A0A4P6YU08_9LACO|nr:DUF5626 family protein [Periweissella cryptocerci]QBO36186.1 hypothetical protein EQG49_06780 [Periweissella cryptocerci]
MKTKGIVVLGVAVVALGLGMNGINADTIENSNPNNWTPAQIADFFNDAKTPSITYNPGVNGAEQTYELLDSNEEAVQVTVSADLDNDAVSDIDVRTGALANGTYTVSKKSLSWKASYKVVVNKDCIIAAKKGSATAFIGSITSKKLKIVSAKKAEYRLTHKIGQVTTTPSIVATIKGSSLKVS